MSSAQDDEPTHAEHADFYESLHDKLAAFCELRLSDVTDRLRRPYIAGDFFYCRSEELLVDPQTLRARVDELVGALDVVQRHLAERRNRNWRVGYFHGDATLLVYPDAIFVGAYRFAEAAGAKQMLGRWLEYLTSLRPA